MIMILFFLFLLVVALLFLASTVFAFATFFVSSVLLISLIRGAPFVPTRKEGVQAMIDLASIKPGMKVADLGSGDGRIVIAFAKAGAQAHGYEINPVLVLWSKMRIKKAGLAHRAFIHWSDFWRQDFASFDVVTIFGITHIMKRLEKKLQKELKPEARVISNVFVFPAWKHSRKEGGVYVYTK